MRMSIADSWAYFRPMESDFQVKIFGSAILKLVPQVLLLKGGGNLWLRIPAGLLSLEAVEQGKAAANYFLYSSVSISMQQMPGSHRDMLPCGKEVRYVYSVCRQSLALGGR